MGAVMTLMQIPSYLCIAVFIIAVGRKAWEIYDNFHLDIPKCVIYEESDSEERKRIIKANRIYHHTIKSIRWHTIKNERSVAINIHAKKYEGSSNDYRNPMLCINDFDDSDEGFYRLEVQYQHMTDYSNKVKLENMKGPCIENPGFSIKKESDLYIGRDICLVAVSSMKPQDILSVLWHKETSEKTTAIDISDSKYMGSSLQGPYPVLRIKAFSKDDIGKYFFTNADEWGTYESSKFLADIEEGPPLSTIKGPNRALAGSTIRIMAVINSFPQQNTVKWLKDGEEIELDEARMQSSIKRLSEYESRIDLVFKSIKSQDEGTYSLKVSNKKGDEDSNTVNLEVLGDRPEITDLKGSTQTGKYSESVTFTAVVKSEPKINRFRWIKKTMKGDNLFLDLERQKYESKLSGENVTLTIQNLQFHDEGEYKLRVSNAVASCESGWLSVKVTGDIAIMISGPTLLFPKERIEFLGCPLKRIANENGFWTKDGNEIDIDGEKEKYRGSSKKSKEPKLFIFGATFKDSGTYRFHVGHEISNEVYVSVSEDALDSSEYENNCLRFYQLVILATEALRIKLKDLVPDLQTRLAKIKDEAKKVKSNKKLFHPVNVPSTDPREFDVSLLYKLLRHHTQIDRPKEWDEKSRTSRDPKDDTFKDPKTCDRNDGGNVERILRHRNKICHVYKLKLETSTFNTEWLDLATAVESLSSGHLLKNIIAVQNSVNVDSEQIKNMQKDIERLREEMAELEEFDERSKISTATYIFIKSNRKEKKSAVKQCLDQICRMLDIIFCWVESSSLSSVLIDDLKNNKTKFYRSETENYISTMRKKMENIRALQEVYLEKTTIFAVDILRKFDFPIINIKFGAKCIALIIKFNSDEDYKSYQGEIKEGKIESDFQNLILQDELLNLFNLKTDDFTLTIRDAEKIDSSEKLSVKIIPPNKCIVGDTTIIRALIKSPIKPSSITWRKDGEAIDTTESKYDGSIENLKHPILVINHTTDNDEGKYDLIVSTAVETTQSLQVPLHLKEDVSKISIRGTTSVHIGQTARFSVQVFSSITPQKIQWRKLGSETQNIDISDPKYTGSNEAPQQIQLCIMEAEFSDGGTYEVVVDGKTDSIDLEVLDSTEIEIRGTTNVTIGQTARFYAMVFSTKPYPEIGWRREHSWKSYETLDISSPKYAGSSLAPQQIQLYIHEVDGKDEGAYVLVVGDKMKSIYLQILEPPRERFWGRYNFETFFWRRHIFEYTWRFMAPPHTGSCITEVGTIHAGKYYVGFNLDEDYTDICINGTECVNFGQTASFFAVARSTKPCDEIHWKRGSEKIDITSPKYAGSLITQYQILLCINKVDTEDAGKYEIAIGDTEESFELEVLAKDFTKITLLGENHVSFGQTARFYAMVFSTRQWHLKDWTKKDGNERKPINISTPKYAGSSIALGQIRLCINEVECEDSGTYCFVIGDKTESLHLNVLEKTTVRVFVPNKCREGETTYIRALIRSPFKPCSMKWRKDGEDIDVSESKYDGSRKSFKQPVLVINNTKKSDEGMYELVVSTAKETARSLQVPLHLKEDRSFFTDDSIASIIKMLTCYPGLKTE